MGDMDNIDISPNNIANNKTALNNETKTVLNSLLNKVFNDEINNVLEEANTPPTTNPSNTNKINPIINISTNENIPNKCGAPGSGHKDLCDVQPASIQLTPDINNDGGMNDGGMNNHAMNLLDNMANDDIKSPTRLSNTIKPPIRPTNTTKTPNNKPRNIPITNKPSNRSMNSLAGRVNDSLILLEEEIGELNDIIDIEITDMNINISNYIMEYKKELLLFFQEFVDSINNQNEKNALNIINKIENHNFNYDYDNINKIKDKIINYITIVKKALDIGTDGMGVNRDGVNKFVNKFVNRDGVNNFVNKFVNKFVNRDGVNRDRLDINKDINNAMDKAANKDINNAMDMERGNIDINMERGGIGINMNKDMNKEKGNMDNNNNMDIGINDINKDMGDENINNKANEDYINDYINNINKQR
eukprot:GHVP01000856.1.p1 GENE.GHVP01000856.1~~GHVP01000856.1.p1  ORF type:complete len:490 (+),score=57.22 GHVP01000856.1:217-1470(+)